MEQLLSKFDTSLNINKGNGAGGSQTNKNGLSFEEVTNNELCLLSQGYVKKDNYLIKENADNTTVFVRQRVLTSYIKKNYNLNLFRNPDEAYIIIPKENNSKQIIIKILEKKFQTCSGSVETKLWSGPSLKREYEIVLGDKFKVEYAFCLNSWFKQKNEKYKILNQILSEAGIHTIYADQDYFKNINEWILK